ncbi:hypothetical protein KIN20_010598 [Parelaphostrongylus tenuis]|uniref:Uncharacterized protein n=1 Tax=Parelaphostrongylus tenuis TaxID=148309 RepID=A0AAD5M832_PARTN|nr:hypothetical protein KIN20_010598 [Parelaphostrongylus tenuis]
MAREIGTHDLQISFQLLRFCMCGGRFEARKCHLCSFHRILRFGTLSHIVF